MPERSQENAKCNIQKDYCFVLNSKGGTFQNVVWYKFSYDSAKTIAFWITSIAPDKSKTLKYF